MKKPKMQERGTVLYQEEKEKMPLRLKDWWKYLLGLGLVFLYLFPFYVIINVSLKEFGDTNARM